MKRKPAIGDHSQASETTPLLRPLDSPRSWTRTLAFAAVAGAFFMGIQVLRLPDVEWNGKIYFLDPDSFTWLSRAERVLNEPGIYVHDHPEDNFPFGYTSHWTQPFHWLLALISLVFSLFKTGREALELAGVWICPLFGALTVGMLAGWTFRRWPWFIALLATLVFMANPFEHWTFSLGRPDHQCLLIIFLMASVLILIGLRQDTPRKGIRLVLSAALLAAGIWITVEGLSVWALCLGALGLRAALSPEDDRDRLLKNALIFSTAAAGFTLLFSLVERKGRLFEVVTDSISTGQAVLMAMPVLGLLISDVIRKKIARLKKTAWFFAVLVPPFMLSALASVWLWQVHRGAHDPGILDATGRWFSTNLEFLPAIFSVNGVFALGRLHGSLACTLYALPFLLYGLYRTRLLNPTGKWTLSIGITLASLLTLWQMRWRDLHSLLIAPLLAIGVCECLALLPPMRPAFDKVGLKKRLVPGLVIFGVSALLILPWIMGTWNSFKPGRMPRQDYYALRHICEWIQTNDPLQSGIEQASTQSDPVTVMAVWDQGPMISYWSGRPVVAGPYHRNMRGIMDTMLAYTAGEEASFEEIAAERRVRYVIRPPLADYLYDIYSFQWIAGVKSPVLWIRSEQITPDGQGTARGFDLCRGKTPENLNHMLRKRLEDNLWTGWPRFEPVVIPGLDKILPDAAMFPYLYRYKGLE